VYIAIMEAGLVSQSLECQTCGEEVKGLTSGWASCSHLSAFITKHCNSGQCCYMAEK